MTDTPTARPLGDVAPHEDDKGRAAAVWVLYLVALFTGLTLIVGVILAYVFRADASLWLRSHYDAQIRIFWWGIVWVALGTVLVFIGLPLSFVIIGLPLLIVGGLMLGLSWLWVLIRSVQGLLRVKDARPI